MPQRLSAAAAVEHGRRGDHHDALIGSKQALRGLALGQIAGARGNPPAAPCARQDRDPAARPSPDPARSTARSLPFRSTISIAFTCSCFIATGVMLALTKCRVRRLHVLIHVRPVAPIGGRQLQAVEGHVERIADALHRGLGVVPLELGEARHQHLLLNRDLEDDQHHEQQRQQRDHFGADIHASLRTRIRAAPLLASLISTACRMRQIAGD